jgi:hypothetical protein
MTNRIDYQTVSYSIFSARRCLVSWAAPLERAELINTVPLRFIVHDSPVVDLHPCEGGAHFTTTNPVTDRRGRKQPYNLGLRAEA